ncbi:MAG: hypothetical protein SH850_05415 [Planctomycetaceae bacterium]|nr:hypothetical protein [Planctomycetaceae bacterium]
MLRFGLPLFALIGLIHLNGWASENVERQLSEQTDLAFERTSLVDVLESIHVRHDLNLVIDDGVLNRGGAELKSPITVVIRGVSVRSALKQILEPLGLAAISIDGGVKITSVAEARQIEAQGPRATPAARPVFLPEPNVVEALIAAKLSERTELAFADTALTDAIDFLKDYHQISIYIDEAALRDEGVDPSTPINLELSGITLRSALRLLLGAQGLTYVIEDEVMKVTTITRAQERVLTRIYPVSDLADTPEDLESLQEAIRTATDGSWNTEGKPGTMSVVLKSKAIVVRHKSAVQDDIVELLTNLRAAQALSEPSRDH